MKQCTKCREYKEHGRFSRSGRYFNSWCKECVALHNSLKKLKKDKKVFEEIVERVEKNERKKSYITERWERAKADNRERCAKRRKNYEEYLQKLESLPKELRKRIKNKEIEPCVVCYERKSWPYLIAGKWMWLCKNHEKKS